MKQHMKKINAIIFTVIVLSMPLIMAFSTPVNSVLAVKLCDDDATNLSIQTLRRNIDNVIVVDYETFEYSIYINRIIAPVIWIGHGSENGVDFKGQQVSWNDFSKNILRTPNMDIMLSCYSNNLVEKTSLTISEVFTFNGIVDAVLGALIASMICSHPVDAESSIMDRLMSIISNKEELMPLLIDGGGLTGPIRLDPGTGGGGSVTFWVEPTPDIILPLIFNQYWVGHLSGAEAAWHICQIIFLAVSICVGEIAGAATLINPIFRSLSSYISTQILLNILLILFYQTFDLISDQALLEAEIALFDGTGSILFDLFLFTLSGLMSWYDSRNPAEQTYISSIILISVVISLLLLFISDGLAVFVKILIYLGAIVLMVINIVNDWKDVDMIVG